MPGLAQELLLPLVTLRPEAPGEAQEAVMLGRRGPGV